MSYVREAGLSTAGRRRRRRTAITLTVLLLFLLAAFGYAVAYYQGWLPQEESAAPGSTQTSSPTTTTPPPLPLPSSVTVNVYNATNRNGLAAATAGELDQRTFEVAEIANDPLDATIEGPAVIRHGESGMQQARALRSHLPDAELVQDDRSGSTVDLVLGTGFEGLAPAPTGGGATPQPST